MRREDAELEAAREALDALAVHPGRGVAAFARVNGADHDEAKPAAPLFDPESIKLRARGWLEQDPPAVEWLLEDALPLGEVAIVAGAGASSKSQLILQVAVGVASGTPIAEGGLGGALWRPAQARPVLMLTAEDRDADLHRRVHAISRVACLERDARHVLGENLHVASVRGLDMRLQRTRDRGASYEATECARQIEALCDAIPGLGLVILEPVSRFRGGDEVDNSAATAQVAWMEAVSERHGCCVLTSAHVSKFANAQLELDQAGVRGASGLVDGARWVCAQRVMSVTEADKLHVLPAERRRYVQIGVVKANNVPYSPNTWLERGVGGYLIHHPLQAQAPREAESTEYLRVVGWVRDKLAREPEECWSATALEVQFGGREGPARVGQKRMREILREAERKGHLLKVGERLLPGKEPEGG